MKRSRLMTQYVVMFGALLVIANLVMGIVMMSRSVQTVRSLVRKNMLEISNTAAALLDGDLMDALTEENVDGPVFQEILESLTAFQNNADIVYIYTVRQTGDDTYVFLVDADPVDPAVFGSESLVTDALRKAGQGMAAVDDEPTRDTWGTFYRAYSPVMNTKSEVAAIVGIDFDSSWYEEKIWEHSVSIAIVTILSVLVGGLLTVIFTGNLRRRFQLLDAELSSLSMDMDALAQEIQVNLPDHVCSYTPSHGKDQHPSKHTMDEIEQLSEKLASLHKELQASLKHTRALAYTDGLTGVGNTTAYLERQKQMEDKIQTGQASFALVVFDINNLKMINDHFGHDGGDHVIKAAANAICKIFGKDGVYRIGGDEFLLMTEHMQSFEVQEKLLSVQRETQDWSNEQVKKGLALSLSAGVAVYEKGRDTCFRDVFVRADQVMYQAKERFHKQHVN